MSKAINIVPYNPNWLEQYKAEVTRIEKALGANLIAIHHIGSTSVPGLASKNKIDIIAGTKDPEFTILALTDLGYNYSGEWNIPFKYGLTLRKHIKVNLHLFDNIKHPAFEASLLFRDYLRFNQDAQKEYTKLKYKLIKQEDSHQKSHPLLYNYTLRKAFFVKKILAKTGFNRLYLQYPAEDEEWQAIKAYRDKYFFTPMGINDPCTWTFNHKDHKHFIFYQGVTIIGYSHVQLWPGDRTTIHIFVIDEDNCKKGYGSSFMQLIEKWLKQKPRCTFKL